MARPVLYIETTIPSFYHDRRTDAQAVARQEWTRSWWDNRRSNYQLVTSVAVMAELKSEQYPEEKRTACLSLLEEIPLVPIEPEVLSVVQAYMAYRVMPAQPAGDALHLALASSHKCDFLLTWNCKHLANANKFGHIRRINTLLGLYVPNLVTPLELLGGEDESAEERRA